MIRADVKMQDICAGCGSNLSYEVKGKSFTRRIAVEYSYDSKNHYDGISEFQCPDCGRREGRWTGRVLEDGESEPPFGKSSEAL